MYFFIYKDIYGGAGKKEKKVWRKGEENWSESQDSFFFYNKNFDWKDQNFFRDNRTMTKEKKLRTNAYKSLVSGKFVCTTTVWRNGCSQKLLVETPKIGESNQTGENEIDDPMTQFHVNWRLLFWHHPKAGRTHELRNFSNILWSKFILASELFITIGP